jgi:hypothetical protein
MLWQDERIQKNQTGKLVTRPSFKLGIYIMNVETRMTCYPHLLTLIKYQLLAISVNFKKGKAIPVTGHGGPHGCETARFPHFLENWLMDGYEVSLIHQLPFGPRKILGTHFC